jgi:hypothetical protein
LRTGDNFYTFPSEPASWQEGQTRPKERDDEMVSRTITLSEASPGEYVWKAVLRDQVRGELAETPRNFWVKEIK